jgi:lauroyl/myristoyl acyltransferase
MSSANGQVESPDRRVVAPRRWTLHGLNNGLIFSATYHGVRMLPRAASYAIGQAGTWLAWRSMSRTRQALADNLSVLFPHEPRPALEKRALTTLQSYARDMIDFVRAIGSSPDESHVLFEAAHPYHELFNNLRARGRGMILVTGHYGNWEIGSMLIRGALDLPLTIVAMAEPSPTVNRIRKEIRESLGADTIEVRQSLDTALQIRRCLADNKIVAMLVDRHFGRDRVPVTLFGRAAWFLRTPFLMAHASGAAVLPCFIERVSPGRFRAHVGQPVFIGTEGSREEAIQRGAQEVADALADRVREHPEFWYHFYKYWDAQRDDYAGL